MRITWNKVVDGTSIITFVTVTINIIKTENSNKYYEDVCLSLEDYYMKSSTYVSVILLFDLAA